MRAARERRLRIQRNLDDGVREGQLQRPGRASRPRAEHAPAACAPTKEPPESAGRRERLTNGERDDARRDRDGPPR